MFTLKTHLIAAASVTALVMPAMAQDEEMPISPSFPTAQFMDDDAQNTSVSADGVTATITIMPPADADSGKLPVLTVEVNGEKVAEATGAETDFNVPTATASLAKMNPGDAYPSVYFASYTGGAHCCNTVIVVQQTGDTWTVVPVGDFDGDGDYLQDLDGDGFAEISTVDNRFLYQFDSYAASVAPLVIYTVQDGAVKDISREERFMPAHRDWLTRIESFLNPEDRWTSPGFLAGWLAAKSIVGEGAEAWEAINANWNFEADEAQEVCTSGGQPEDCPAENLTMMKFPDRLRIFLTEAGYTF